MIGYQMLPKTVSILTKMTKISSLYMVNVSESGAIPCLHFHVPSPEVNTASHRIVQPIAAMMGSGRHGVHLLSPRQRTTERAFLTS